MGAREAAALVSLAFLLWVPRAVAGTLIAPENQEDQALTGCGICYPGGYDLNTAGSLGGTVVELQLPSEGPVRFTVEAEGERWVVLASPLRHWRAEGLNLGRGDSVAVRGSKSLGADGVLYLVAQEIRLTGAQGGVVLRDARGRPLWRGSRGAGGGAGRGCSSPRP